MSEQYPRSEFADVDHARTPSDYVHLLDAQQSRAFVQQYKQRCRVLLDLHPGQQVLDAGAGTGEDAQEMAKLVEPFGQVMGLDVSQIMIEEARLRVQDPTLPVRFVQGDLHHVPFANETFDRCFASRTFQHLADPKLALAELVRVIKPGGLLVIVEPDHETRVIDTPYPDITRRFLRFRNDGMRQPDIGHRLYALFKDAGLIEVQVEPLTQVTTDYETVRAVARLMEGMRLAQQFGVVTAVEAERWILYLEEAIRTEHFFMSMTSFITRGRKPI